MITVTNSIKAPLNDFIRIGKRFLSQKINLLIPLRDETEGRYNNLLKIITSIKTEHFRIEVEKERVAHFKGLEFFVKDTDVIFTFSLVRFLYLGSLTEGLSELKKNIYRMYPFHTDEVEAYFSEIKQAIAVEFFFLSKQWEEYVKYDKLFEEKREVLRKLIDEVEDGYKKDGGDLFGNSHLYHNMRNLMLDHVPEEWKEKRLVYYA